ncbi:MAG: hypothetical protein BEN19_07370 [Epulopiscium sp. Nuni2H_MBin003]|nr:MAG: hypothetical protein BEN19_07370 [Epulopiscium sp. Nuni2H_MBin003]
MIDMVLGLVVFFLLLKSYSYRKKISVLEEKLVRRKNRAQQKILHDTVEQYELTEEQGRSMMVLIDEDLKIQYISPKLLTLLGYNIEEYSELDYKSVFHVQDYELRMKHIERVLNDGEGTFLLEHRIKTKNEKTKYLECYYVYKPYKLKRYVYVSVIDVTDRRIRENDLKSAYEIDELLLNSIETKVVALDKSGNVIALNNAMRRAIPNNDRFIADLDDVCLRDEKIIEKVCKVLDGKEKGLMFKHRTKFLDNESWHLINIQGGMKDYGCIMSYIDITENAKLDISIKEREETHKELLNRLPCAVVATNSREGITYCNYEFLRLLKLDDKSEVIGKILLHYIKLDTRRQFIEKFFSTSTEQVKTMHQILIDKEGNEIYAEIERTKAILDNKLTDIYTISDLSDKVKVEEYKESLDKKELELTRGKEEVQFKTEFFANISHDLRAPINVISSAAQLMSALDGEEDYKNGSIDKYSKIIKQNCTILLKLVSNVIDMNKIESGFYTLDIQKYNIVNIVEELTLSIVSYVECKEIELIFDTEIEECVVEIDINSMERIILNLLSNAVKFTPKGGKIEVRICQDFPNVIISIKDSGVGIEEDKLELIFERFKQAKSKDKIKEQGSGIGLSLVKSLVELQGGIVDVMSTVGNGSEFRVILPSTSADLDEYYCDIKTDPQKIDVEFSEIAN